MIFGDGLDAEEIVDLARSSGCAVQPHGVPAVSTFRAASLSWREYYSLRNALLMVLNRYGTAGPTGELPILETWELSEDAWKPGAQEPDFFVVSDMYNEWDRWHRIEASPSLVNGDLLSELIALLLSWPDWCLYMALKVGGLTVFRDRILYEGKTFDGSGSIADLAARCEAAERTA
jgi:hypothetical protein